MRKLYFLCVLTFLLSCQKKNIDYRAFQMQEFVKEISDQAKTRKPGFLIIPQNGLELCFENLSTNDGAKQCYVDAIDGVGIEALFENGTTTPPDVGTRLEEAKLIKQLGKSVLVSDFTSDQTSFQNSLDYNDSNGFIPFPRLSDNYDYTNIQTTIHNENAEDIFTLDSVKNYLYLINSSQFDSKQQFLDSLKTTNYDLVLIDVFFNGEQFTKEEISSLKTKQNGGNRLVIAYMNIGAAEDYRFYWKDHWKPKFPHWIVKEYEGYPNEFWVKYWSLGWENLIYRKEDSYLDKVLESDFDGAYLDNVEAYYELTQD